MPIIFGISILLTLSLQAETCFDGGKIRQIYRGKYQEKTVAFCINHSEHKIVSKNCLRGKCDALKKHKKEFPTVSTRSNPLFTLCRMRGGIPKIVEYYSSKEWKRVSLCTYPDQSFISI